MRTILPGRPPSKLQALSSAFWNGLRVVVCASKPFTLEVALMLMLLKAYVSGNAIVILGGAQQLLQTIYLNDANYLVAVTVDEQSGKIAVSDGDRIFVYAPQGKDERVLKVILIDLRN